MGKRTVTVGLFVCAAVAACNLGSSEDDAATSESANTEARQPLLAPTWAKCWVEKDTAAASEFFQLHSVKCRYDAPDAKQPIKPRWFTVEVHDARGGAQFKRLEETPGEDVLVRRVNNEGFPLRIYAHVSTEDLKTVGLEGASLIDLRVEIANLDAATIERPLEIKQPFDLWPVRIIQKHTFFALQLERRPLSIAPFRFGQGDDAPTDGFAAGVAIGRELGATSSHYFIAPKQGGLTAKYHGNVEVPNVRIDGPGYYVAGEREFRRATDEEASGADPAPPPPESDAAAPEPIVSDAAAADAAPEASGPPPTCGVTGLECCGGPSGNGFGGTCSEGSFCAAGNNVCVACGDPTEKCCGGPNNNGFGGTCNAGSFCMAGNNVCVSCGNAGEKCCGGPNGNGFGGTCNTGSFCMSGNNVCVTCGKPGEKCCGGPNNNGFGGTCDPGATCAAGNNVCVANP